MVAVEDSDHEIHSMQGDDENMEDEGTHIYGCLDNVGTHTNPHTHSRAVMLMNCHFFFFLKSPPITSVNE